MLTPRMTGSPHPWTVVGPFIHSTTDRWVTGFADSTRHSFRLLPRRGLEASWRTRSAAVTTPREWLDHLASANRALLDGAAPVAP